MNHAPKSPSEGKKNGNVDPSHYQSEEMLLKLDPIAARLRTELGDAFDRASLADLLVQFLQFMEDVSGISGTYKGQPKIPMKVLRDYRPEGPIFSMAARIHQIRKLRDMTIQFGNTQRRREHLEVYMNVRRELEKLRFIEPPKVFVDPSCSPHDTARMRESVAKLGGMVANSSDEAGITHHVFSFPPTGDPDDGQVYLRVQEFSGTKALVHWWYLPDSYDEWIGREYAPDQLQQDVPPLAGPWKVYIRWVYDSEKYNEWMNPSDYETKEAQEEQEQAAGATGQTHEHLKATGHEAHNAMTARMGTHQGSSHSKDPLTAFTPGGARIPVPPHGGGLLTTKRPLDWQEAFGGKRPRPMEPAAAVVVLPEVSGEGEQLVPYVTQHKVLEPHKAVAEGAMTTENISQGLLAHNATNGHGPTHLPLAFHSSARAQERRSVPEASWFSVDSIDEREKQAFPEFFHGRIPGKTPKVYRDWRNLIVEEDKKAQGGGGVSLAEVRSKVADTVDTSSFNRIFEFLASAGVVGRHDDQTPLLNEQRGRRHSSRPLNNADNVLVMAARAAMYRTWDNVLVAAATGGNVFNLSARKAMFTAKNMVDRAFPTDVHCSVFPWVKCSELRYHCTKAPGLDICPEAFAKGMFPAGMTSKDFVRVTHRTVYEKDDNGWTAQESLLLLTSLEMFGDNWAEVSDHVGTKTQVQCMLQFLQIPIEDLFTSNMEHSLKNGEQAATTPFGDSSNAVMSQVAFLTSFLGPSTAAASAKRALEVLLDDVCPSTGMFEDSVMDVSSDLAVIELPEEKVTKAAGQALTAAAKRAQQLADVEERHVQRLVSSALALQSQKLESRIKRVDDLSKALVLETDSMDEVRTKLQAELMSLLHQGQQQHDQAAHILKL